MKLGAELEISEQLSAENFSPDEMRWFCQKQLKMSFPINGKTYCLDLSPIPNEMSICQIVFLHIYDDDKLLASNMAVKK